MWRKRYLSLILCLSFALSALSAESQPGQSSETLAPDPEASSEQSFQEACSRIYDLAVSAGRRREGAEILDLLAESEESSERRWMEADRLRMEMQRQLEISRKCSVAGWTAAGTLAAMIMASLLIH